MHCIVFSRDRAMQLDAFLCSVGRHASTAYTTVSVLYTTTSDRHRMAYDTVVAAYPTIAWHRESSFRADLLRLLGAEPLTVFHTDDDVFFRTFAIPEPSADEVCFSLRLGLNTSYCYPLDTAEGAVGATVENGRVRWAWRDQRPGSFAYPLSLNGHVFRTSDAVDWLSSASYANPNELEAALQELGDGLAPMMASFEQSAVTSIPLNVVNDVYANRAEWTHDVEELNERFLLGQRMEPEHMDFNHVTSAHERLAPVFSRDDPQLAPIFAAWARERRAWITRREDQLAEHRELVEAHESLAAGHRELTEANEWLRDERAAWEDTARRNSRAVEELQARLLESVAKDTPGTDAA